MRGWSILMKVRGWAGLINWKHSWPTSYLLCIPESIGRWSAFLRLPDGRVAGPWEKIGAGAMVFGRSLCTSGRVLEICYLISPACPGRVSDCQELASLDEVHWGLYYIRHPERSRASGVRDAWHDVREKPVSESNNKLCHPKLKLEEAKHQWVQQANVEAAEDQLSLSQLWATQEHSKSFGSIPPLVIVDPKGKAPKTPTSNPKKRKLAKALEVKLKNTELLALAMFAAKTVEANAESASVLALQLWPPPTHEPQRRGIQRRGGREGYPSCVVEVQVEIFNEQSPSSATESELIKAQKNFAFDANKKGELPANMPIE